jgi:hypothetical protein
MQGSVARWVWNLERFGLTPAKLAARARNRTQPKILCISLPKAGTHLLERALCLHPALYRKVLPTLHDDNIGRWHDLTFLLRSLAPGQILVSHLHHRPEYRASLAASGVRCLFLVRDPRDLLVSQAHYIAAERGHRLHDLFAGQPTLQDRLRLAISGDVPHRLPSIGQRLGDFAGWLDDSDLVVRYEDLIGGEATAARQRTTLHQLYQALGMPQTDAFIGGVQDRLRSRVSPTFRRGSTGEWREHFTDETEALFRRAAGPVVERYGYPLPAER